MSNTLRTRLQTSRVFLLSSLSWEERREYGKVIQKLGGVYFDSESFKACCTHLICGRPSRSEKFLGALATGKWILKPEYILASQEAKVWLPEDQFEWQPTYGNQSDFLIYAPMRWRLHFALNGEPAFQGWKVSVLVSDKKRALVYKRLLTSGGAKLYTLKMPLKDPVRVANTVTFIFTDSAMLQQLLDLQLPDYGLLLLKPDYIGDFLIRDPQPDPMDYILSAAPSDPAQDTSSKSINSSLETTSLMPSQMSAVVPSTVLPKSVVNLPKESSEPVQSIIQTHISVKPLATSQNGNTTVRQLKIPAQVSKKIGIKDQEATTLSQTSLRSIRRMSKAKRKSSLVLINSDCSDVSTSDCRRLFEQLVNVSKKKDSTEETDSMKYDCSVLQSGRRLSKRFSKRSTISAHCHDANKETDSLKSNTSFLLSGRRLSKRLSRSQRTLMSNIQPLVSQLTPSRGEVQSNSTIEKCSKVSKRGNVSGVNPKHLVDIHSKELEDLQNHQDKRNISNKTSLCSHVEMRKISTRSMKSKIYCENATCSLNDVSFKNNKALVSRTSIPENIQVERTPRSQESEGVSQGSTSVSSLCGKDLIVLLSDCENLPSTRTSASLDGSTGANIKSSVVKVENESDLKDSSIAVSRSVSLKRICSENMSRRSARLKSIRRASLHKLGNEKTNSMSLKTLQLESNSESGNNIIHCLSKLSQSSSNSRNPSQDSLHATPIKMSQSSLQDFGFSSSSKSQTQVRLARHLNRTSSSPGSPGTLSQENRLCCSQPDTTKDFELDAFIPSRKEVLEEDVMFVKDKGNTQTFLTGPELTNNNLKHKCGAKRKIFVDVDLSNTQPLVKRRKMAQLLQPVEPWYPVSLGTNMTRIPTTEQDVSIGPSQIPSCVCNLILICVEEGFQQEALTMLQPYTHMCPTFHILSVIITNVLLKAKTPYIAHMAYRLLMDSLNHHPPTSKMIKDIYLNVFGVQDEDGVWGFICSIISGAVRVSDSQYKYKLALQYILAVFRHDFSNFISSIASCSQESGRSLYRSCMILKCLWYPSYLMFPNTHTQQLLTFLEQCFFMPIHCTHRESVLESVLGLVSMAAQTCQLADCKPGSDLLAMGERTSLFVRELARKIIDSHIEDEKTLVTTLRNLQPSWLCLKVCQHLLGNLDDFLLIMRPDDRPLTLKKIVSQYFFLLPRLVCTDDEVKTSNILQVRRKCFHPLKSESVKEGSRREEDQPPPDMAAKINKRNHLGETALHTACIKNNVPKLNKLLSVPGVDVNAEDNAGWTPLHEACNKGHIDCVKALLHFVPVRTVDTYFKKEVNRRVDLLSATPDGVTPLHDAVVNNRLEVCRLLLKHGGPALLKVKTSSGQLPIDLSTNLSMSNLLTTLPTPVKNSGEEISSSQDSQPFPSRERTSFLPSSVLYEQVLGQNGQPMRASIADCRQYITMIKFLLHAYLQISHLLSRNCVPSVKGAQVSHKMLQEHSTAKENLVPLKICRTTRRPAMLSANILDKRRVPGTDLVNVADADRCAKEQLVNELMQTSSTCLEEDLKVLPHLKQHMKNFSTHISKITSPQDFKILEKQLSYMNVFLLAAAKSGCV